MASTARSFAASVAAASGHGARLAPDAADAALSFQLMCEIARRTLARTVAAAADPADMSRSLPLPLPAMQQLTLAEALAAAVHHLDAIEAARGGAPDLDAESCLGEAAPGLPPQILRGRRDAR